MSELIYQDESGNELKREVKGRGRPPTGAVKQTEGAEEGNFIVVVSKDGPLVEPRVSPEYITVDSKGNEVGSRVSKGRGRPKPGFEKHTDGPFAGHWVKVVMENTEAEVTEVSTEVKTVVETPEQEIVTA